MPTAYAKCFDPNGARFGVPTYPWRMSPHGYATRRQLRAKGLRPGGQPIAAQVMVTNRKTGTPRVAFLYREDLAKPVRPMSSRKWGALALAMLARRTCPRCRLDVGYCIPTSHGICGLCLAAEEQRTA
ncbi:MULTISPECIES: RRQRL motif-containing zinc-binding protein [Streptomyces]|uniref:RRQRL motif-containing zinc-binding protein n=1 Tax=Streptomyces doebereineriae TaxID=3075528 RepID=A0ABU2V446_9ACTN|nr:RRQRL motif-containing zinc-binding protein [Streptomyces sp. DSM 41640]MDT0480333.1 RRQRL motif-containing zinc-binding protein [Streptomyces sp. DSM 41640]